MNTTTRSASGTAIGLSSTALTTEKIAVLAPMPSVSAATAARVKAGLCANMRKECFKSFTNASMGRLSVRQLGQRQAGPHHECARLPSHRESLGIGMIDQGPDGAAESRAEAARRERAMRHRGRGQRSGGGYLVAQQ